MSEIEEYSMNPNDQLRAVYSQLKETFPQDLCCAICMGLPFEPLECPECSEIFCGACIDQALAIKEKCPKCRQNLEKQQLQKLSRKLLNMINEFKIEECPLCTQNGQFNSTSFRQHLEQDCDYFNIECQYKCGERFLRKEQKNHDCPNMIKRCDKCDLELQRDAREEHDCIKQIARKLTQKEQIIDLLVEEVTLLRKQNEQYKDQIFFLPKQFQIQKSLMLSSEYSNQPQPNIKRIKQAFSKVQANDFKYRCTSCTHIAVKARECKTCHKIVCFYCKCCNILESTYKESKLQSFISDYPINKCLKCNDPSLTTIGKQLDHFYRSCPQILVECPLSSQCPKFLRPQYESHLNQCSYVSVNCPKCGDIVKQENIDTHDCIATLTKRINLISKCDK